MKKCKIRVAHDDGQRAPVNGGHMNDSIYWHTTPGKKYDITRLMPDFETQEGAEDAWRNCIECLENGKKSHRKLAKKLKKCCYEAPCMCPACPKCMRDYRLWYSGQGLQLLTLHDKDDRLNPKCLKFVTIVPIDRERELNELLDPSCSPSLLLKRMKDQLRNQLIRAGLGHLIIFGGIEADFDVETQKWEPHFHLIVIGLDTESREWWLFMQNNGYAKNAKWGDTPVRVDQVNDWPRQVSYCLKTAFLRKESWLDKDTNKKKKRKVPLKPSQQRIALSFLAGLKIEERLFLFNIRRNGCELEISQSVTNSVKLPEMEPDL